MGSLIRGGRPFTLTVFIPCLVQIASFIIVFFEYNGCRDAVSAKGSDKVGDVVVRVFDKKRERPDLVNVLILLDNKEVLGNPFVHETTNGISHPLVICTQCSKFLN